MTGKILSLEERYVWGQELVVFMWPRGLPEIHLNIHWSFQNTEFCFTVVFNSSCY